MSQFSKIKTSPALPPYCSLRAQEYALRVIYVLSSRPAAGNTCVSMAKMRILGPKSRQNDKFQVEFSKFFRKPQGGFVWMFYDVFWCPGALGTFLEWSWMNSGNFIFLMTFLRILTSKCRFWMSLCSGAFNDMSNLSMRFDRACLEIFLSKFPAQTFS